LLPIGKRQAQQRKSQNRKALIINMQKSNQQGSKAIVLVHGGFVRDGPVSTTY
jgi:hypothetical protein